MYNTSKAVVPGATVVHYGYGGINPEPMSLSTTGSEAELGYEDGWSLPFPSAACTRNSNYAGDERFDVFSNYLYDIGEPMSTRLQFNKTATAARAAGAAGVVPVLALGSGFVKQPSMGTRFSFSNNYSLAYSWRLGAKMNNPKFSSNLGRPASAIWGSVTLSGPGKYLSHQNGCMQQNTVPGSGNPHTCTPF